jgi:ABC-type transport system involved in multi-copper enzyme maturation permease subunit
MNSIFAIAKVTLVEQLRNRLYSIILFFGAAMLVASILLGTLAPGHSVRVIFDVGLVALELFGLVTAVFGAVTLVIQEIESKTIYLMLTRPLKRSTYIIGRFVGLLAAVAITMLSMAVLHVLVMVSHPMDFRLFTEGWSFSVVYPTLVFMSMGKMLVTAAVALFFSLFATSQVSALVFTGCFWVAGHFLTELNYLIYRSFKGGLAGRVLHWVFYVFPNFQIFNFRDTYAIPGFPGYEFIGWAVLYSVAYTGFFIILSSILFSRREF